MAKQRACVPRLFSRKPLVSAAGDLGAAEVWQSTNAPQGRPNGTLPHDHLALQNQCDSSRTQLTTIHINPLYNEQQLVDPVWLSAASGCRAEPESDIATTGDADKIRLEMEPPKRGFLQDYTVNTAHQNAPLSHLHPRFRQLLLSMIQYESCVSLEVKPWHATAECGCFHLFVTNLVQSTRDIPMRSDDASPSPTHANKCKQPVRPPFPLSFLFSSNQP